jgi:Zn-dependent peptidase ImmA (M78 family)
MTKEETEQSLNRLTEYLTNNGVKVEFNSEGDNAYYPIPNIIRINTRQNVKSRYYSLLHEVGHYLLRQQSDFGTKYLIDHSFSNKNKDKRIDVLREEIAAWDKAYEFISINKYAFEESKWQHYSKKFIYQYAMWVVNPSRFEDA